MTDIDVNMKKEEIRKAAAEAERSNYRSQMRLKRKSVLTDYRSLAIHEEQDGEEILVWTDALQKALMENDIVYIPASDVPYYTDRPVIIPSDRRIEAEDGALISLKKGVSTIMFRNEHISDGTHRPVHSCERDSNIAIIGGRWNGAADHRTGCGKVSDRNDDDSFHGVAALMFFNNMTGLTLEGMTISCAGGFAVQAGDICSVLMRDISFEQCFADGLHKTLWARKPTCFSGWEESPYSFLSLARL